MKATLPPNTLVQAIDVDPDVIGRVLRLAKDAEEYGDEEYVIQWPSGQQDLRPRNDLFVWPRPSVFDVRAIASEVGLEVGRNFPPEKTDEELLRWLLECLKRRYDEADEINRLLPYTGQDSIHRVKGLLASVDAARKEVKVARARAEETRLELEALSLRVVPDLTPNGQDFVWASVNEDGTVQGMPRVVRQASRRDDRGRPPRYIVGPDPKLVLGEK